PPGKEKNNNKIKSQDQIDTIRGLGLGKIRFDPSKSDVKPKSVSTDLTDPPLSRASPLPQLFWGVFTVEY
ncbi:MAG: DUF3391 domain-containing protein, partial [Pseudomonas proteolytica]|uniref:DUF3391 domain-containing protein n=1 Tax=Pseudomonas proteolytica TaxID=219574 RepID=UPI003F2FF512